jgi:hypothetical protein
LKQNQKIIEEIKSKLKDDKLCAKMNKLQENLSSLTDIIQENIDKERENSPKKSNKRSLRVVA